MKKWTIICFLAYAICSNAQIGYQVALLNKATGEPRSGVTVNATVKIEDSKGGIIFQGIQAATSNDFGILSLTIGDDNLFKNVDFGKMPFFISVTVDGTLIGKSQILSVPIAEAAKKLVSGISRGELVGRWKANAKFEEEILELEFRNAGNVILRAYYGGDATWEAESEVYEICGNIIYTTLHELTSLIYRNGKLFANQTHFIKQ